MPCTLKFGAEWGEGETFDWCRKTFKNNTIINRLEIRITQSAGVPHRFIVAYMQDGPMWRFDRRPRAPRRILIPLNPQDGPGEEPSRRAADTVCHVTRADLLMLELSTHCEIRLDLPPEADIFLIISACFAIAQDKKARNFTLLEYNCYFFSWTVIMLMVRHLFPFTVPSPAAVESRITARLAETSATVGDRIVEALLHIGLSAVTVFDEVTGKNLNKGLSKQELAVHRCLPAPVLHSVLRRCLEVQLRLGLKKKLDRQVYKQLNDRMVSVFGTILGARQDDARGYNKVADAVEHRLWLNQLLEDLRQPIEEGILEVLWDNILEAVSQGYGDVQPDVVHQGFRGISFFEHLKHRLLGKNVIQFSQIWNEGLRAALPAAREAGHGKYRKGMTHGDMFDLAFKAGIAAALEAAKDVVERTRSEVDSKRNEMWEYVWTIWDEILERVRVTTRDKVVGLVEQTLADLVGWVAEDVVRELGDNDRQKVQATIRFKRLKLRLQDEGAELSTEVFQQHIGNFIQSVSGQTPERRAHIEEAMSNAWDVSRTTYKRVNVPA
ncbi:hypothetical protein FS749_016472 [Ceratobasidium sp. UAMH 11750]|nr:hypothetical protein FS749_016472 [Ceratobasidium sp. UAMH 11750]